MQTAQARSKEQEEAVAKHISALGQNETVKYLLNTIMQKIEPELQVTLGEGIDTEVKILVKDHMGRNGQFKEVYSYESESATPVRAQAEPQKAEGASTSGKAAESVAKVKVELDSTPKATLAKKPEPPAPQPNATAASYADAISASLQAAKQQSPDPSKAEVAKIQSEIKEKENSILQAKIQQQMLESLKDKIAKKQTEGKNETVSLVKEKEVKSPVAEMAEGLLNSQTTLEAAPAAPKSDSSEDKKATAVAKTLALAKSKSEHPLSGGLFHHLNMDVQTEADEPRKASSAPATAKDANHTLAKTDLKSAPANSTTTALPQKSSEKAASPRPAKNATQALSQVASRSGPAANATAATQAYSTAQALSAPKNSTATEVKK